MGGFEGVIRGLCLAAGVLLLVAVVAFRAGRTRGRLEGIRLGRAEALIVARERALQLGFCPVCSWEPPPRLVTAANGDIQPCGRQPAVSADCGGHIV